MQAVEQQRVIELIEAILLGTIEEPRNAAVAVGVTIYNLLERALLHHCVVLVGKQAQVAVAVCGAHGVELARLGCL